MKNLVKAVLAVMDECKGIDKSLTVGTGQNTYKGVSDKDVKLKIGQSMHKHGLIILPTSVKPTTNTHHYTDQYGKPKMTVFTEVVTEYLLIHESGEQASLVGFGHGTDSQDKSAGKATTYALKYTLLYSFLVATGHIDDSDNIHSDDIPTPPPPKKVVSPTKADPSYSDASKDLAYGGQLEGKYGELILSVEKLGYLTPEESSKMTPKVEWDESKYRIAYNWVLARKNKYDEASAKAAEEKRQAVKNVRTNS
jgi:hypothetical protein